MNSKNSLVALVPLLLASHSSLAGPPVVSLPLVVGTPLPVGIGGVVAIAAVSLVIGTQLIRRKKK